MEDLVKELTIDMVPDGDNRIIAETIGVENYYKDVYKRQLQDLRQAAEGHRPDAGARGAADDGGVLRSLDGVEEHLSLIHI